MHTISKPRRWIFISIVVLLALAGVTPVLADYLGPDRTETTYVAYCRYVQKRCAQQDNGQWVLGLLAWKSGLLRRWGRL